MAGQNDLTFFKQITQKVKFKNPLIFHMIEGVSQCH